LRNTKQKIQRIIDQNNGAFNDLNANPRITET